ncbi:GntR family transcriptional regulator [Planomonospora venezuelensis]|nr:GntR family transcriptional regulator [Planomonospora venezuelensis]
MSAQVNDFHEAIPAPSLATRAYEAIRDMIVTLEIRPGAAISEDALSAQLGMGRTPIREAIKRLEVDSLVAIYPRRGTFATEVNITDLALITEIRQALEPRAAHSAALRRTAADVKQLTALREACRTSMPDDDGLMRLDRAAHGAIYRSSHNRFLEANLMQYYNLVHRIWHLFLTRLPHLSEHIAEHVPLLDAIIEGRAEDAEQMVRQHVSGFEQTIRSII